MQANIAVVLFIWRMLPKPVVQRLQHTDVYSRAYPAPNGFIESDLFAGLD